MCRRETLGHTVVNQTHRRFGDAKRWTIGRCAAVGYAPVPDFGYSIPRTNIPKLALQGIFSAAPICFRQLVCRSIIVFKGLFFINWQIVNEGFT